MVEVMGGPLGNQNDTLSLSLSIMYPATPVSIHSSILKGNFSCDQTVV